MSSKLNPLTGSSSSLSTTSVSSSISASSSSSYSTSDIHSSSLSYQPDITPPDSPCEGTALHSAQNGISLSCVDNNHRERVSRIPIIPPKHIARPDQPKSSISTTTCDLPFRPTVPTSNCLGLGFDFVLPSREDAVLLQHAYIMPTKSPLLPSKSSPLQPTTRALKSPHDTPLSSPATPIPKPRLVPVTLNLDLPSPIAPLPSPLL